MTVGGAMGDAFGSMMHLSSNHSIGMPPSPVTEQISQMNGLLSKAFFRGYIIPVGKAINVQAKFSGLTNVSNNPVTGVSTITWQRNCDTEQSFIPQPGKDYEVVAEGRCGLAVLQANDVNGKTEWQRIPLKSAVQCARP